MGGIHRVYLVLRKTWKRRSSAPYVGCEQGQSPLWPHSEKDACHVAVFSFYCSYRLIEITLFHSSGVGDWPSGWTLAICCVDSDYRHH